MDDQYQPVIPVPGARLGAAVRAAWSRVFGAWRPDQRTVGVLLVAWFLGGLVDRLVTADSAWTGFINAVTASDLFRPVPGQLMVQAVLRLLYIPAEVLAVAGGAGLALRREWGRAVAACALAALLAIDLVGSITGLTNANALTLRPQIAGLIASLGAALPLAVLLWSRPPRDDG